jgi:hypothetical protein
MEPPMPGTLFILIQTHFPFGFLTKTATGCPCLEGRGRNVAFLIWGWGWVRHFQFSFPRKE